MMVSDWSGAAIEYAFALEKPVIFCDVPRKVNNPDYQEIDREPIEVSIREKIGTIWDGVSPLAEVMDLCDQKSQGDWQALRKASVFNQGRADEVFKQFLIER